MTDKTTGRDYEKPPATGHNGWPLHGTMAHVHAAAHIAANCPNGVHMEESLRIAIYGMRIQAIRVCELIERMYEAKGGET